MKSYLNRKDDEVFVTVTEDDGTPIEYVHLKEGHPIITKPDALIIKYCENKITQNRQWVQQNGEYHLVINGTDYGYVAYSRDDHGWFAFQPNGNPALFRSGVAAGGWENLDQAKNWLRSRSAP